MMLNVFEIVQLSNLKQAESAHKAKNAWRYFSTQKKSNPKAGSIAQPTTNFKCCSFA
jgi:hypothetical protein